MHDQDQDRLYQRVANNFAATISSLFDSEDTLKAKFSELFPGLEFSRTDHWGGIIYKVFRDCWMEMGPEVKGEPTGYDRNVVLTKLHGHRLLDYNLFTQVMLNLQSYTGMAYQAQDAEEDIKKLEEEWKGKEKSPFSAGARMVKLSHTTTDEDIKFNHDLSTLKSLKIIASFTPQLSFRVSPKGSTPTLVDANNVSNLGVGSDKYLRVMPSLKAWYIHWQPGASPTMVKPVGATGVTGQPGKPGKPEDIVFHETDFLYFFHSKSGGEILNQVLFSRRIAFEVFPEYDHTTQTCIILPRMSSVLVVADEEGVGVKAAFYRLRSKFPILELAEGTRQA